MGRGYGSYIRKADFRALKTIKVCMYCGIPKNGLHIEHIIALSSGGDSQPDNLTVACGRCNSLKASFSIDDFLDRIWDKREDEGKECRRFLSQVRNYRKRRTIWNEDSVKDYDRAVGKVKFHFSEYRYFSRILFSLMNNNFILDLESIKENG